MTSLSALDVLALTLYGEARGEPVEGQIAVANVIRNRRRDGRWGQTYEGVCLARLQFSCWSPDGGGANYLKLVKLRELVMAGRMPADAALKACYGIALALDQWILDNTHGATHYHTASLHPRPAWAIDEHPIATIGGHLFYRDID